MYEPADAVTAGFLDRVVASADLAEARATMVGELAELNPEAHSATKLRARGAALTALRAAIDAEFPPAP
jgi:enoyl-CoA hydratase